MFPRSSFDRQLVTQWIAQKEWAPLQETLKASLAIVAAPAKPDALIPVVELAVLLDKVPMDIQDAARTELQVYQDRLRASLIRSDCILPSVQPFYFNRKVRYYLAEVCLLRAELCKATSPQKAIHLVEAAGKYHPKSQSARVLLAELLVMTNQLELAEWCVTELIQRAKSANHLMLRAEILIKLNKKPTALEDMNQAIQLAKHPRVEWLQARKALLRELNFALPSFSLAPITFRHTGVNSIDMKHHSGPALR